LATETVSLTGTDGRVVCERCLVAARPLRRMRGLLGRRTLPSDEGLLLRPAGSIHTAFMRFPIDAVFLDRDNRVVKVVSDLAPWRTAAFRGARAVLELQAGEAARRGLRAGICLSQVWRSAPAPRPRPQTARP
jgi:uncharacterized membrane protein (UPF0127 family)